MHATISSNNGRAEKIWSNSSENKVRPAVRVQRTVSNVDRIVPYEFFVFRVR